MQSIAASARAASPEEIIAMVEALTDLNTTIYDDCVQLNPAANVMNPRAEAALSAGLGSRPSLGYPGDKYEMGVEAVEQIEVIAAQLACDVVRWRLRRSARGVRCTRQPLHLHGVLPAWGLDHRAVCLGGPPSGLLVTNDMAIAERVDSIAFPGLTANFDVGKTASLAMALVDWQLHGPAYVTEMLASSDALQSALDDHGIEALATRSHAFAVRTADGHELAERLRAANLLTSGIGLPGAIGEGMNGLRLGTNEIVRWGMTSTHMSDLASLIARAITADRASTLASVGAEVTDFRQQFRDLHFVV